MYGACLQSVYNLPLYNMGLRKLKLNRNITQQVPQTNIKRFLAQSTSSNSGMDMFRDFLESSSIHGLNYISTTGKFSRLFWTLIVVTSFIGASTLIFQSFKDWNDSPIKTTIESVPISQLRFPKVTVCPPKHTFTNLNDDIMKTKKIMTPEKN